MTLYIQKLGEAPKPLLTTDLQQALNLSVKLNCDLFIDSTVVYSPNIDDDLNYRLISKHNLKMPEYQ